MKHAGGRSVRSLTGRLAVVAALGLSLGACQDLFLADPAPADPPVVVDLGPMLLGGPGRVPIDAVLPDVNGLAVRVVDQETGEEIFESTVSVDLTDPDPEVRLEIPLGEESVQARGEFALLFQGEPLLAAVENFVLRRGEETVVRPTPDPEVASVEVTPVSTITSLGVEFPIAASALYATGDVIDGATFSYSVSDPDVLEPIAGQPGRFRAVGEGPANVTVTATAGEIEFDQTNDSETIRVDVSPEVVRLEAEPTSLELLVDASAEVVVRALDARGNELPRLIDFTSTDTDFVTVESTGAGTAEVTGVSPGTADVVASFEDLSVTIPVTVSGGVAVSLEAEPSSALMEVGETTDVRVRALDAAGGEVPLPGPLALTSSNTDVVTVASGGTGIARLTGQALGMAEVTATSGDLSVVVPVNVTPPLGSGDVQVTLTWNTTADLDLWVTDPFGEVIAYFNRTSDSGGMLDFDDTNGFGPENIFWPEGEAPAGTYRVQVDHFSGASPSEWQVRVTTAAGTETYSGTILTGQTVEVVEFTLSGHQTSCLDGGCDSAPPPPRSSRPAKGGSAGPGG